MLHSFKENSTDEYELVWALSLSGPLNHFAMHGMA